MADSPRRLLLDAIGACLQRITVANGFNTDAGLSWTSEPGQIDGAGEAVVLTAVIAKQRRAADPAFARTHRDTDVAVVIKVPAALDAEQSALDLIVTDVEAALDGQQARFPRGITYPQYQQMEPVKAPAGAGWVGAVVTFQSRTPIK